MLDAVVDQITARARLLLLWQHRQGGLTAKQAQRLLRLLRHLQRRKEEGLTVVPS